MYCWPPRKRAGVTNDTESSLAQFDEGARRELYDVWWAAMPTVTVPVQALLERLVRAVERLIDAVVEEVLQRGVRRHVGGQQRDERDGADREQQPAS